ncbi:ZXD family zinc finger protein [Euroglyphus maynei]|uniref:ZXD family zinc finger protein n=1 Tax=Euroglyphus maynei TaxID=6958 RepID=A0A1Y3BSC7_EURMA|nr:ZXD family zinc finger protein [Euroglyphus maynei]
MDAIEIKPTEIICLQTNESLFDFDFIRKCLHSLLEYKNYVQKLYNESNIINDEKSRYEYERIEQRFQETIRGNEALLQRYLQEDWATEEFSTTLQTFCDPNMDQSDGVTQAYIVQQQPQTATTVQQTVDNMNASSYNNLGEKKDVMAIAAAEVVMHSYRDGLYICGWPSCEYQTSSRRHINNHKLVHTGDGEFNCSFPECGRRFKTREELNEHAAVHNSDHPYPCVWPGCEFRSQTPASLKAHMRVHMERKFKCDWPDSIAHKTIVAQQQSGGANVGNTSVVVPSTQPQPITTAIAVAGTNAMINTQLFRCNNSNCSSLFSTLYDLKQHMMQHSKVEKPFRCDIPNCEYSALTKTQLNEHKVTHSSERNYICTVENCGRRYKTRKGLWDHSHTHRADKPFACAFPNCTYRCVSSSYLRSHMRAHKDHNPNAANNASNAAAVATANAAQQPQPQVVANAPQQFFAPGTMIQHPDGHQEFICGVMNCGKSFDSQGAYLNHVKLHAPITTQTQVTHAIAAPPPPPPPQPTPPKSRSRNPELARFKCEFEGCTAAYKLKRNLKDHMIRHTILEKPYRCDWPGCDYGSYKSTNVAKHKSVHSDERKYACDYYNCEKKFKTREGLRKHMLSHHKPPVMNNTAAGTIQQQQQQTATVVTNATAIVNANNQSATTTTMQAMKTEVVGQQITQQQPQQVTVSVSTS